MGADRIDIIRLLAVRYTAPILAANLLAWPIAYGVMWGWLRGFAGHVGVELWIFAAAGACALVIGWATVGIHAFFVAGGKPARALRYE